MADRHNKTVSLEINTKHRDPFANWLPIRNCLIQGGWKTPNTYGNEFGEIDSFPAVYLFAAVDLSFGGDRSEISGFVAYVGMSKRLADRLASHPIKAKLNKHEWFIQTWFMPEKEPLLRETERRFIRAFDPPFNLSGKVAGLVSQ